MTGRIWVTEHGPAGGDELNVIEKGQNYGWPLVSHGRHYDGTSVPFGVSLEGTVPPERQWTPSIAPSGLAFYGNNGPEVWRRTAWLGALSGQAIIRLHFAEGGVARERRFLKDQIDRVRDVRLAPDGAVYIITDNEQGALYRLDPIIEQADKEELFNAIETEVQ